MAHPVAWLGRLVARLERAAPAGRVPQLLWGAAIATGVPLTAALAGSGATRVAGSLPAATGLVVEAVALKPAFALRGLLAAAGSVRGSLRAGDLTGARDAVAMIVSRDTSALDAGQVAAAAIESLAENLTDSVLAPWLAYAVAGLPGVYAYRALNTLDSMIGYHGRYEYLGKAAARLDDLANVAPARIGALLIAMAAPAGGGSVRRAWRRARQQHRRTASPNAGWTMAAMAGALGVELEKVGHYRLGGGRQPGAEDIVRAQRIAVAAAALGLVFVGALAAWNGRRR